MKEADFRLELIEIHRIFGQRLLEVAERMIPYAFDEKADKDESHSLRILFTEVSDNVTCNQLRMEELSLSGPPLLEIRHPNKCN